MAIFGKLFGRKTPILAPEPQTPRPACPHTTAAPQWDSAADMGREDRASRFVCAACGQSFTPAEFTALRATEAERIRHLMEAAPSGDAEGA